MLRGLKTTSLCLVLVACGCNGGGKSTSIMQYPRWNWEAYRRLAVVPYRYPKGRPGAPEAAQQATYMLEDLLAANGNFTILERGALKDIVTEQDLSQLADVADPSTVLAPGKIQSAQAIVLGKITECDLEAERSQLKRNVYARDNKGRIRRDRAGRPIVVRVETIPVYRHEARVGGSVRVIDAATSKVIFSHHVKPITHDETRRGSRPSNSPKDLAVEAAKELAVDCYKAVAPVRTKVKLKSDSLIIALDYYDGEYDKTKKVSTALDSFMVVVRKLPMQCDRNPFRVAIAPEEGRNIWEEEFVWSSHNPARGKSWRVPLAPLKSTGGEKFIAKLYSGTSEEPLLKRDFKLEPPEEAD